MKDEFLATLSHELRTPLSAILGWAQILRDDARLPTQLHEAAKIIERNARMQAQIIDDLLDMNRIISGKVRLDVQHVDLSQIIESAIETVRPAATAKGVRLQPVLDGWPARSAAIQTAPAGFLEPAVQCHQVHTPRGGRVQIILQRIDSHIEVKVADNGEGLAPEFLPMSSTVSCRPTPPPPEGTAAWARARHRPPARRAARWSVRAESPGLHQGASFTVSLPLLPIHSHPPAERRHPRASRSILSTGSLPRLDGIRVLVVDDDPTPALFPAIS